MSEQEKITGEMLYGLYSAERDSAIGAFERIADYVNERMAKATPPPMSEERRREAIEKSAIYSHGKADNYTTKLWEKLLCEWGLIPPRPELSIGERLMHACRVEWANGAGDRIVAKINKAFGPFLWRVKCDARGGDDSADDLLANLEKLLGEK